MSRTRQMSLGVDISQTHLSLALMAKDKQGVRLVRGLQVPLPEGAIVGGRLHDVEKLGQTLHKLIVKHKMKAPATLSVLDTTILSQMIELPQRIPTHIGAFVKSELKQCVAVSGESMLSSYGRIGTSAQGHHRLLAVAADSQQVAQLLYMSRKSGLAIVNLEPAMLAYVRALYASRVVANRNDTVLLIWCRDHALQLCVFRGGRIDLMRSRNIQSVGNDPEALCRRIGEELGATLQYYDIEGLDKSDTWRISVVTDAALPLPADALSRLQSYRPDAQFESMPEHEMAGRMPGADAATTVPSVVAMGLALQMLEPMECLPAINLLPPHILQARTLRRQTLVAGLVAVLGGACIWLAILGLTWHADQTRARLAIFMDRHDVNDTVVGKDRQQLLDTRIELLSRTYTRIQALVNTHADVDWSGLLTDIYGQVDPNIRITGLDSSSEGAEVVIDGHAQSYSDVGTFADRLRGCARIGSVLIAKATYPTRETMEPGRVQPVTYEIKCQLPLQAGQEP